MSPFVGLIPQELIEDIKNNKCILFVGSGLSCQVKRSNNKFLPNWAGLLQEMLTYAIGNNVEFWGNSSDIEEMIKKYNLLTAAQELQDRLELSEMGDFLNGVFRDKKVKPTESHLTLPKIPFKAILTSNYDTLIESGYIINSGGVAPNIFTQKDLGNISSPLRKDDFYIFKIHGDINRLDTIVLGSRDYQKLFYQSPDYRQFLETLFSVHTVLFVGFGGTDPDLDNILERLSTIYSRTIGKHYILLPEDKYNFTEKRRLLLDKRLQVIEYKKDKTHSQVNSFISDLSKNFIKFRKRRKTKNQKYDVFISHSSLDNKIAKRINETLRNNKISTFYALEDLKLTDKIRTVTTLSNSISEMISQSKVMIIILTPNSMNSKGVGLELQMAMMREIENKINILPIVIGEFDLSDIPGYIYEKMFLKLSHNFGYNELNRITQTVKKMITVANNR